MEATNVNLKIVVFEQNTRVKVINIETFDGLDTEIDAFGFIWFQFFYSPITCGVKWGI